MKKTIIAAAIAAGLGGTSASAEVTRTPFHCNCSG